MVSWLIPVYNCASSLCRAIESILNQTFQNFEVIIVIEKGTDDETVGICERYEKNDSRFKLVRNSERLGIGKSLNVGLIHCKGKYIARMDADDYSLPERLAIQVDYMERNPSVFILGGNARIVNEQNRTESLKYERKLNQEELRVKLLFETCFVHPAIVMRNEDGINYPERIAEDYALFSLMVSEKKMHMLQDVVIEYHEGVQNNSKKMFKQVRTDSGKISRETISRELDIDTSEFHKSLFGWRGLDEMPEKPEEFLKEAIKLYKCIADANEKLCKFEPHILSNQLRDEWNKTLNLIRPYFFPTLYTFVEEIDEKRIESAFVDLNLNEEKKSKIIYGTGYLCKRWMDNASEEEIRQVVCFCDMDKEKQDKKIYDKLVIAPEKLKNYDFDKIVISPTSSFNEIRIYLNELGINNDKIELLKAPNAVRSFHNEYIKRVERISKYCPPKRAFLFCAADYGNLGDHAIAEAEHRFMRQHYGIELCEIPCATQRNYMHLLHSVIDKDDIIIISGGGFLGSLWINGELNVQQILREFPYNRIIIFPQTMYWEEGQEELLDISKQCFKGHVGEIVICARDYTTYNKMNIYYEGCRILLAPDIVLSADWKNDFCKKSRKGAFLCLKDDKESVLSDKEKEKIEIKVHKYVDSISSFKTDLNKAIYEASRISELRKVLNVVSGAELIITDRLHGMIFSYITNTPCVVLKGLSHKLEEGYMWISETPFIEYANSTDELEECINRVLVGAMCDYRNDLHSKFEELANLSI